MPKSRTIKVAVAAAALAATAMARWHPNAAEVPDAGAHAQQLHTEPGAVYLPSLFVDEERDAPVEPLPPQF